MTTNPAIHDFAELRVNTVFFPDLKISTRDNQASLHTGKFAAKIHIQQISMQDAPTPVRALDAAVDIAPAALRHLASGNRTEVRSADTLQAMDFFIWQDNCRSPSVWLGAR